MKPIRLAIFGATGLVGKTTLDVLQEWKVPLAELKLFASQNSHGTEIRFGSRAIRVEAFNGKPPDVEAAILATSADLSRELAPRLAEAGILTIDHSSEFRMRDDVPLVIPEINRAHMAKHQGLISNPNCSASVMLLPLAALDQRFGLESVISSTYQSVSGSGVDAIAELNQQVAGESPPRVYPRTIAFNVIPQVGAIDDNGDCFEEVKVGDEIRKILNRPNLHVLTTTVRVPVRIGHAAAVTVRLNKTAAKEEIERAFQDMPGMVYEKKDYRTPLEIAGLQEVFVSRLRVSKQDGRWIQFWCVCDNLRKGAASNAVQILQELFS
jgi:aspartate-semialdehyde dehydrogenase